MELNVNKTRILGVGNLGLLRLLLLVTVLFTAVLSVILVSHVPDSEPSSMTMSLRIIENMTLAHIWSQNYVVGGGRHEKQDINRIFEEAYADIKVMFEGGIADGNSILPLDTQDEILQLREIEKAIRQLEAITTSYLNRTFQVETYTEFDNEYDGLYLELVNHTKSFNSSSLHFLRRYHRRFEILQIVIIVLGLGFALAVFWISKYSDIAQAKAWNEVKRIRDQRELALLGAKLGTWDWNIITGLLEVNDRWAEMIGLDPKKMPPNFQAWEKRVHPDDLARVAKDLDDHLEGKTPHLKSEYRLKGEDGEWVWILDLGKVWKYDSHGKPERAAGIHLDVTDIKMSELELRREKDKAQLYLDMARVIFVAIDTEGIVQMINREGCRVLGCSEKDIVGKNWLENFVPQRFREATREVASGLLAEGCDDNEFFVNPILAAGSKEALISWHNTTLHDGTGNVIGHLSSGTDITIQDKREKALQKHQKQLQSLASRLAQAEDHLRQEIAAGLHDSIGQNLAALKLSVDIMRLNMGTTGDNKNLDLENGLQTVSQTIDEIVRETWSLSFQLCPPGLQESGIVSAVEWLVSQYNQEHDCGFSLTVPDSSMDIDRARRGLLFQMIRELLINTIKHGEASEVGIALARDNDFLLATVTDNGKGFDPEKILTDAGKSAGFGLFSIRERLAYISGKLEIHSAAGEGTRAIIHFPLKELSPDDESTNL